MEIERVEQRGTKVYAYDENGEKLFKKTGELVRYTSKAVFVRRGNKICKMDAYGYVVDPDVKDEGVVVLWWVLWWWGCWVGGLETLWAFEQQPPRHPNTFF
ncbi:hypothetical protein NHP21005_18390 [Helicobacter sp. NHP21005]|uniref:hypothetical protein n=1 Tax=Helicobacter felistomachi TaxID=3040201 RepID=UPI002573E0CD|nr:hypothetical protein [Helicobacter sp. NHP21005]BEG58151.1 hypothetical protein NHP21005_18390 [Helicobacter sp. NHP21005]